MKRFSSATLATTAAILIIATSFVLGLLLFSRVEESKARPSIPNGTYTIRDNMLRDADLYEWKKLENGIVLFDYMCEKGGNWDYDINGIPTFVPSNRQRARIHLTDPDHKQVYPDIDVYVNSEGLIDAIYVDVESVNINQAEVKVNGLLSPRDVLNHCKEVMNQMESLINK